METMSLHALKANDLRWLACPACRQSLQVEADSIRCVGCARRFPVVDGIPILLVDRALQHPAIRETSHPYVS
jgi:uncharacterized protein YbaR (Trm112 family)